MLRPLSPVQQSKETRSITEGLLNTEKDTFLHSVASQNKSLEQLQQKEHDLDQRVQLLSDKVQRCGNKLFFLLIIQPINTSLVVKIKVRISVIEIRMRGSDVVIRVRSSVSQRRAQQ